MSTELTIQQPTEIITPASAESFAGLPHMQASLLVWCRQKYDLVKQEATELWAAYEQAKIHKWKTAVIKKHATLADKRAEYYEKIADALGAGYCVFPSMDCDIFAIRTEAESPHYHCQFFSVGYHPDWADNSEAPASGEGEYVNPVPEKSSYPDSVGSPTQANPDNRLEGRMYRTTGNFDQVQFPLSMAKPGIMDSVARAMALKIFDQIGIIGDKATSQATRRRQRDPLIVGRVLNPKRRTSLLGREDAVCFLLSWHVRTKDLEA